MKQICLPSFISTDPADSQKTAMLRAAFIGMVAGISGLSLEWGAYYLSQLRLSACNIYPAWIVLPAAGLIGGLSSGYLVQRYSPTAYGSGIPQVRAYLLGAKQPLALRLALVKLIAGSIALGSGLVLGREGPTVHVGAAMSAEINKWFPANKIHEKQLVAAGAGAGLAAAFNAPMAGVLFVAEELLKDVSNSTIGTAILACFVASAFTHILNAPHTSTAAQVQALDLQFNWIDCVFWVLLGIFAGVAGTIFNYGVLFFLKQYRRFPKIPVAWRVGLAGLISGAILAAMPRPDHFRSYAALTDLIITGHTDWTTALAAFVAFFFLSLLAYGSGAPGGLFAPSLLLGASLGSLVSYIESFLVGASSEQTMAMIGMGAFFAAVARVPITAVVIISEITHHYNLVPPLMVVTAVASFVGSRIEKGSVYDMLREYSGLDEEVRLLRETEKQPTAVMLMKPVATSLALDSSHEDLIFAVKNIQLAGLPIVEDGKFVGFVETSLLMKNAQLVLPTDVNLKELVSKENFALAPSARLEEIQSIFEKSTCNTIAVTENERLIGLIHREDLNFALANMLERTEMKLEPVALPGES